MFNVGGYSIEQLALLAVIEENKLLIVIESQPNNSGF